MLQVLAGAGDKAGDGGGDGECRGALVLIFPLLHAAGAVKDVIVYDQRVSEVGDPGTL